MTRTTTLITTGGTVELHAEEGGYRWLTQEGDDTETSGRSYEAVIEAGLMAWPEGVVVVVNDRLSTDDAAALIAPVADWLTA